LKYKTHNIIHRWLEAIVTVKPEAIVIGPTERQFLPLVVVMFSAIESSLNAMALDAAAPKYCPPCTVAVVIVVALPSASTVITGIEVAEPYVAAVTPVVPKPKLVLAVATLVTSDKLFAFSSEVDSVVTASAAEVAAAVAEFAALVADVLAAEAELLALVADVAAALALLLALVAWVEAVVAEPEAAVALEAALVADVLAAEALEAALVA
jgi:hypothetical protein